MKKQILLTIGLATLLASATQACQETLAQSFTEARAETTGPPNNSRPHSVP